MPYKHSQLKKHMPYKHSQLKGIKNNPNHPHNHPKSKSSS